MKQKVYTYPITIKETDLDLYGHVNNATYFTLFEQARWEMITINGYGFEKIMATGLGPVILEATIRYRKELKLRDEVVIETWTESYDKKIGKMKQRMKRSEVECCTATFAFGLFNLKERKLVLPTEEWLKGIDWQLS